MSAVDLTKEQQEASRRIAEILHHGTVEELDALLALIDSAETFAAAFERAQRRLHDVPAAGTA